MARGSLLEPYGFDNERSRMVKEKDVQTLVGEGLVEAVREHIDRDRPDEARRELETLPGADADWLASVLKGLPD